MEQDRTTELVDMVVSMARLDFSKKLQTNMSNEPLDVLAYGLNMLSEELQHKVSEQDRLEQLNQNLESFSFTVAHDLKSPILASNGLIDLIEHELNDEELSRENLMEYLSVLKEANRQTIKMIHGILEYSRVGYEKMNTKDVDLSALCNAIKNEYNWSSKVEINIQENLPFVQHNEVALNQVLNNLVNNAIKHNDKDVCCIAITHCVVDGFHHISVSDNGPGISSRDQKVIFNLFENLRNNQTESSGVGLAIVDKIVSRRNGKVWVESGNELGGATFTFSIPISDKKQLTKVISV